MPDEVKPYRLYKGGRAKGRVPLERHRSRGDGGRKGGPATPGAPPTPTRRRKRRWGRRIALGLAIVLLLTIAWGIAGYLSVASAVGDANARIPDAVRDQLSEPDGLVVSTPRRILVIGTDGGSQAGREGARRSDSIMLLRTDPSRRRLAYLSIPRDLRVDVPGYGPQKINAAFQLGGPALTLRTVEALTGIGVDHVAFVDFDGFKELIDAVGGVDVNVSKPIVSNRFDCPYDTNAKCNAWPGWRFGKGVQRMDGRRALAYSRIRENKLDPSESDFTRGRRQQQVVEATADRLTSVGSFLRLPFIGDSVVAPLSTDLSAWEASQLGWVYFRSNPDRALHCRLGGDPQTVDGESVILGSEDNVSTIAMFEGRSAPLPPRKGDLYAPGCVVGR